MLTRFSALALATALAISGASKKAPPTSRAENEDVVLTATLYLTPADVKEVIGDDLGGHYIVVDVKIEPKYGKDIVVDRDDFFLRTDKDGERTQPYAASQIAGSGALVVSMVDHNEGVASPGWTGTKVPVVKGGSASTSPQNGDPKADAKDPKAEAKEEAKERAAESPLKKTLDAKILPEGKTDKPISGLLCFPMEKQKMKDLELTYGGKDNKIRLRFKQ